VAGLEVPANKDWKGLEEVGAVGAVTGAAVGAKAELAAAPLGVALLDCCWPKILLELPKTEAGGLAAVAGVEEAKSEGADVCAAFWPKREDAADVCSLALGLPSGEVLMSSTSLVTPKRGF
jgi:hypothetical protein